LNKYEEKAQKMMEKVKKIEKKEKDAHSLSTTLGTTY
jgi:hypothetical protein